MPSVTIVGTNSQSVSLNFDSSSNFALASQIAAQITAGVTTSTVVPASDVNGAPPAVGNDKIGAYYQTQTGTVIMPNGYAVDVVTKQGNAVVLGGNGSNRPGYQQILSDAGTNLSFIASGGNGTVVASDGTNRFAVSGGNWSLNTGNGNDIIIATNGNDSISAGAGNNTIYVSNGQFFIESTGNDTIQIGSGSVTINATFGGSDRVQAATGNLLFIGGTGGATIVGGSGSDTYYGSQSASGPQVVYGGSAGNNFLMAGDGAATLVGGGTNDQLFAYGSSNQLLKAGSGNATLWRGAASGNNTLMAGAGSDYIIGGFGNDTFVDGSGSATVQAGFGDDVFEFIKGQSGGQTLIEGYYDFTASAIRIHLQGYDSNEVDNALDGQTVSNGSVTLSLSDGTTITFQNVTALDNSKFI
jgi:Ca2+-binding RTX toxin-like protein